MLYGIRSLIHDQDARFQVISINEFLELQGAETEEHEQEEGFVSITQPKFRTEATRKVAFFLPVSLRHFDSLWYIHVDLSCMSIWYFALYVQKDNAREYLTNEHVF